MTTVAPTKETNNFGRSTAWVARALTYFVYAIVVINELILLLGFTLKLFGANPSAGFTDWAYRNLERVMVPFRGIFPPVELGAGTVDVQPVFDTSILFAMLIYGILALALRSLIDWLAYRIASIDSRTEQERLQAAADARAAADAEYRAAQIQAMTAQGTPTEFTPVAGTTASPSPQSPPQVG